MINDPRTPNAFVRPLPARSSGAKTVIKIVAGVIAVLVALLLGLIILFLIGVETGPVALLIGMVSATLPVPIYLMLVLWIDRYESEPAWMLATGGSFKLCAAPAAARTHASGIEHTTAIRIESPPSGSAPLSIWAHRCQGAIR